MIYTQSNIQDILNLCIFYNLQGAVPQGVDDYTTHDIASCYVLNTPPSGPLKPNLSKSQSLLSRPYFKYKPAHKKIPTTQNRVIRIIHIHNRPHTALLAFCHLFPFHCVNTIKPSVALP